MNLIRKLLKNNNTESDSKQIDDIEEAKKNYRNCDIAYSEFEEKCGGNLKLYGVSTNINKFVWILFGALCLEFALTYYLLAETLGGGGALYNSVLTILTVVISAVSLAFCIANTSRNLPIWRKTLASIFAIFQVLLFLIALGLLSSWRADSVDYSIQRIIIGYQSMLQIEVFVVAMLNLVMFVFISYEFKQLICPTFWGHKQVHENRENAKNVWERLNDEQTIR